MLALKLENNPPDGSGVDECHPPPSEISNHFQANFAELIVELDCF